MNNQSTNQPQAPDDGFNSILGPLPAQPINSAASSFADKIAAIGNAKAPAAPAPAASKSAPAQIVQNLEDTFNSGAKNVESDIGNEQDLANNAGGGTVAQVAAPLATAGHIAGDIAGTAGGILGSVIEPFLPEAAKQGLNNVAQTINQKLDAIPGMTPDIKKSLGDVFNTVSLLGGAEAEPIVTAGAKTAAESAAGTVSDIAQGAKEAVTTSPEEAAAKASASKDAFVKDLITPNQTAKDITGAIKTGKVDEGGIFTPRDTTKAIPNFDKIQESVSQVPGISPKNTLLENANAIHDEIGSVAESLKTQLQGKGSFTPAEFNKYMGTVKSSLKENPMITGDAESTAGKIVNKFNSLVAEKGYTPGGLLDARKSLDQWMSSQKGSSIFDPKTDTAISVAMKAIRQGGNDFLADRPGIKGSVDVKGLLQHQSNLYRAIDNIAPKAAKEGSTGFEQLTKTHPVVTHLVKHALPYVAGGIAGGYLSSKL